MNTGFFDIFFFGTGNKPKEKDYAIEKAWGGLNLFYYLISLVMGRFEYEFPETMDPRFYELSLICDGVNGTAKDPTPQNFSVGYGNKFSQYGYYNNVNLMDYMGLSHGMYIPKCPGNVEPDCVLTYDNLYNIAPISRIKWYANRLTKLQGSIAACIENLKGTIIIQCSEEQVPAVKKAWADASDGKPVIIGFGENNGGLGEEPKVTTSSQTGEILKQLQEAYDKTMAEFLTEFGINANGVINKLSGVSSTELQQNDQARQINLMNALKMREKGINEINEMFGLNCSVKLADPLAIVKEDPDYGSDDISGTDE